MYVCVCVCLWPYLEGDLSCLWMRDHVVGRKATRGREVCVKEEERERICNRVRWGVMDRASGWREEERGDTAGQRGAPDIAMQGCTENMWLGGQTEKCGGGQKCNCVPQRGTWQAGGV